MTTLSTNPSAMNTNPAPPSDDFYVGYLPRSPRTHASASRAAVAACILLSLLCAALIAAAQQPHPDGLWESTPTTLRGLFVARPYPLLILPPDQHHPAPRAVLLLGSGKCGALTSGALCSSPPDHPRDIADSFHHSPVRARGLVVRRSRLADPRAAPLAPLHHALELDTHDTALMLAHDDPAAASLTPITPQLIAPSITLIGDLVDPKCFLGVMKPGTGHAHRACAVRCISGGIPPAILTRLPAAIDPSASPCLVLLAGPGDTPFNQHALPFVADHVTASGSLSRLADIYILTLEPAAISRP